MNNWGHVHWLPGGPSNEKESFAASIHKVQAASSDIKQSLLPLTLDLCGTMSAAGEGEREGLVADMSLLRALVFQKHDAVGRQGEIQ